MVERETFRPLGISGSRFGAGPVSDLPAAMGHIPVGRAVAPFGIVFLPLVAAAADVLWPARRLRGRGWIATVIAAGATIAFLFSRAANPRMVPFRPGLRSLRRAPVPDGTAAGGNAASSLRASAGGLARFLVELSRPSLLEPALAVELRALGGPTYWADE